MGVFQGASKFLSWINYNMKVSLAALIFSDTRLIPLAAHEGHGKVSGEGSISQSDIADSVVVDSQ